MAESFASMEDRGVDDRGPYPDIPPGVSPHDMPWLEEKTRDSNPTATRPLHEIFHIPGYQDVRVERGISGSVFLYIGDNFVAFNPDQWESFLSRIVE